MPLPCQAPAAPRDRRVPRPPPSCSPRSRASRPPPSCAGPAPPPGFRAAIIGACVPRSPGQLRSTPAASAGGPRRARPSRRGRAIRGSCRRCCTGG